MKRIKRLRRRKGSGNTKKSQKIRNCLTTSSYTYYNILKLDQKSPFINEDQFASQPSYNPAQNNKYYI